MSTIDYEAVLATMPETKFFVLQTDALSQLPAVIRRAVGADTANTDSQPEVAIFADGNTWSVAGEDVERVLKDAAISMRRAFIFPGTPLLEPLYKHIETLREELEYSDAIPIAVGSGTINDLVKRASHEVGRPYILVPTAASMDGITSFGAAIIKEGFKQTLPCPAPIAVVAETSILVNAPIKMSAAGYGDLASELTAGADWIVADALGVEAIHRSSWEIVQPHLRRWLAPAGGIPRRSNHSFELLIEGLTMNGFAMQMMGSSRPASGAEHLFSHVWEMEHLRHQGEPVSHGFKVAIGTLIVTAIYELLLENNLSSLDIDGIVASWPTFKEREKSINRAIPVATIAAKSVELSRKKYLEPDALRERLELLVQTWPELRPKIAAQLLTYQELRELFLAAGAPTRLEEISLTRDHVRETFIVAQMIRNRFTVLDLIFETGLLESFAERITESNRYLG